MKRLRYFLIAILLLILIGGTLVMFGRRYLASPRAAQQVAARLADAFGGRVEVGEVDVGLQESAARKLKLYETGDGAPSEPWVEVDEVSADLPLWDLIRGQAMPRQVSLSGAAVTLRFDAHGKLLTRLPERKKGTGEEALPEVRLQNGQVTLRQQDRPDTVIHNIDATLRPGDSGRLVLEGTVRDAFWGDWTLDGTFDIKAAGGALTLRTPPTHVTQKKLEAVPLVRPQVWGAVKLEGDTPVELTLRLDPADKDFHYRVAVEPVHTTVDVTAIDLHAEEASGKVVIEDGVVRLRGVTGQTAGGRIEMTGDLDFTGDADRLRFYVRVGRVVLSRLPKSWKVPQLIDGLLTGQADLLVTIRGKQVITDGSGDGVVQEAKFAGVPAEPITLKLHASGDGFRFTPGKKVASGGRKPPVQELPTGGLRPPLALALTLLMAPPEDERPGSLLGDLTDLPGELVGWMLQGITQAGRAIADGGRRFMQALPSANGGQPAPPTYLEANLNLRDVDLQQLLSGLKVESPVRVAGRLTIGLQLAVPVNTPNELKAYRLKGDATLRSFRLEGVEMEEARARVNYDNGVLRVEQLSGRFPPAKAGAEPGTLDGTARLQVAPPGPGQGELHFRRVDVGALLKQVPNFPVRIEGRASGAVVANVPAPGPGGERPLNVQIDMQSPQLRVQSIPAEGLRGMVNYRAGALKYKLEGRTLGGTFDLEGQLPPDKPRPPAEPPQGSLSLRGAELGQLWPALGVAPVLGPLRGMVDLAVTFRQADRDGAAGDGQFVVSRVRWAEAELTGALRGRVRLQRGELRFRDISGTVGQGLLRSQVAINLRELERSWYTLEIDHIEAERLLRPWPALAARVEGLMDVRLRGSLGRESHGNGVAVLARGKISGVDVAEWRLPLDYTLDSAGRAQLEVRDSSAQLGGGRVTGTASVGLGTGTRTDGRIRFYGVDLRPVLRPLTDGSQVVGGLVTGRIDFRGQDVRSVNDLTATIEARLQQARATQLPVFRQLAPYLRRGSGTSGELFNEGDLRAVLARGVVRVQRLALAGSVVKLWADGTVTLEGRLNLNVVANTGLLGINPEALRLAGIQLPAVGPIPLVTLVRVTSYLSNRTIYLRVSGTVNSPTIRVEALPLLAEEAVRFFLLQAAVPIP